MEMLVIYDKRSVDENTIIASVKVLAFNSIRLISDYLTRWIRP